MLRFHLFIMHVKDSMIYTLRHVIKVDVAITVAVVVVVNFYVVQIALIQFHTAEQRRQQNNNGNRRSHM